MESGLEQIDGNQTRSTGLSEKTKISFENNQTLLIELHPIRDANSSIGEGGVFKAKIIDSQ